MKSEVISQAVRDWITEMLITMNRKEYVRLCHEAEVLIASGYGLAQLRFVIDEKLPNCQIVPMTMREK